MWSIRCAVSLGLLLTAAVGCDDDASSVAESEAHLLRRIETARLEAQPIAGRTGWSIYCELLAESKGEFPSLAPPVLERHRDELERLRPLVPRLIEMSRLPFGKSYDAAVCYSELAASCERVGEVHAAAQHRAKWRNSYLEVDGVESSRIHIGGLLESRAFANLLVLAAREASERGEYVTACDYLIAARDFGGNWVRRVLAVERSIGAALVSIANTELRVVLQESGAAFDAVARARLDSAFASGELLSGSLAPLADVDADDEKSERSMANVVAGLDAECLATRLAIESVEYFHAHGRWPFEPAELPAWLVTLRDHPALASSIMFEVNDAVPSFGVDYRQFVRS